MARDPKTPRSFGLIPRTPPGIRRAESPRLAAQGPPPPGAKLVPVVRAYERAAVASGGVAAVALACGLLAGFGGKHWLVIVLLYVGLIGGGSRVTFSTPELDEISAIGTAVTLESTVRGLLRAVVPPALIVGLAVGITLFDSDRFFLTFIIGMNGGYALTQWSVARRLAACESRAGVQLVAHLPLRATPMSLDGKLWSRPGTSAGAAGPAATA